MIIAQHGNFTVIATQSPSKLEASKAAAVGGEVVKEAETVKAAE